MLDVIQTCCEMLRDRKYLEVPEAPPPAPIETKYSFSCKDREGSEVCVFFFFKHKLGIGDTEVILKNNTDKHLIIVCRDFTPRAKQALANFEIFKTIELRVNLSRHEDVPPHRILTEPETHKVLKRAFVNEYTKSKFPHINASDIQARYLGAKPGQVLEISRRKGYYYRLVVK
jgi:DNA-directed RNA polymerase subunit H (RpoH/RPB5)